MTEKTKEEWAELGRRFEKLGTKIAKQTASAAAEVFGEMAKGLHSLESQFDDWSKKSKESDDKPDVD